ncbi:hypothetical protein EDEG_01295 [Edhazardia aedis USNM 41457]|uniref:Transcription factor CBF/NF-Y/archaeal histone domain-containing protein n=1 Tax=Edhazardia aedis (strain USNM 41457) TaxID=1003232 RepID=J8ZXR4_EDHAE|nr:hypothetical protein EDEG_01295 [Edhazardia aedis USNM 41457]|eukprot:EJW04478.1 hypothetical protein EDEG_01295 [Edhazardia aedis USNM 41457]
MDPYNMRNNSRFRLEQYWHLAIESAKKENVTSKYNLPLARIKRLMKVEEEVKMVACEVPVIFSKVTEKFIEELTLRAWLNTEENKRRILQRNDLSAAVRTSDVFDFLVYIIPKTDLISIDGLMYDDMTMESEEFDHESFDR